MPIGTADSHVCVRNAISLHNLNGDARVCHRKMTGAAGRGTPPAPSPQSTATWLANTAAPALPTPIAIAFPTPVVVLEKYVVMIGTWEIQKVF